MIHKIDNLNKYILKTITSLESPKSTIITHSSRERENSHAKAWRTDVGRKPKAARHFRSDFEFPAHCETRRWQKTNGMMAITQFEN